MRCLLYLVWKDTKNFLTDSRALFLAFLFPLILIFVVVNVYPSGGETGKGRLIFGLVSYEDEGGLSREIISFWEKEQAVPMSCFTLEEAYQKLQEDELDAFLFFPSDFTSRIYAGEKAALVVYTNPENIKGRLAALRLAQGLANSITYAQKSLKLVEIYKGISMEELVEGLRSQYGSELIPGLSEPVSVTVNKVGPLVPVNRINWALPAFFTMFVFMVVALGAVDLVKEKENHIVERLAAGGTEKGIILGAKFMSSFLKGLVQVIILWGAGILFFDLYIGSSFFALLFLSASFIAAASAFSLYIVSVSPNSSFAFSLGVLSSLIMAPLGGCWWPVYIMPPWMRCLGNLTPHAWANSAFTRLLILGGDLRSAASEIVILLIFTLVFYLYAVKKFNYN